jgi:hypothetical protein
MNSQVDFCLFNYLSVDENVSHDTLFIYLFIIFYFKQFQS